MAKNKKATSKASDVVEALGKFAPQARLSPALEQWASKAYDGSLTFVDDEGETVKGDFQTVCLLNSIEGQIEIIESRDEITPLDGMDAAFWSIAVFHLLDDNGDFVKGKHLPFSINPNVYSLIGACVKQEAKNNAIAFGEVQAKTREEAKAAREAEKASKAEAKAKAKADADAEKASKAKASKASKGKKDKAERSSPVAKASRAGRK